MCCQTARPLYRYQFWDFVTFTDTHEERNIVKEERCYAHCNPFLIIVCLYNLRLLFCSYLRKVHKCHSATSQHSYLGIIVIRKISWKQFKYIS